MCERKFFGVEEKAAHGLDGVFYVGVGDRVVAAFVIDLVANDRVVYVGHVDADLVGPAGLYLDIEQGEFCETLADLPDRYRAAAVGGDLHPQAVVLVAADRGLDRAGVFFRGPVNERDIRFVNRSLAKLLRQGLMDLIGFGDDDQARGVFVEAMDDAYPVRTACVTGGSAAKL